MKRFFCTLGKWTCSPLKYLITVTAALFICFSMTVYVMPISVSSLITYIGFTEDATSLVIMFMGGVPALFMCGLYLYFTIAAIRYVHRYVFDYFDRARLKFDEMLESTESAKTSKSSKSLKPSK